MLSGFINQIQVRKCVEITQINLKIMTGKTQHAGQQGDFFYWMAIREVEQRRER